MQVGFGPALVAIESGAPLRIIAGSNLLTVHAVYSKKPEIRRLQDLQRRTVGVGKLGALTHQLIYAALRKHGVDAGHSALRVDRQQRDDIPRVAGGRGGCGIR